MTSTMRLDPGEVQYNYLEGEYKRITGVRGNIQALEDSIPGAKYSFIAVLILLSAVAFGFSCLQYDVPFFD